MVVIGGGEDVIGVLRNPKLMKIKKYLIIPVE
jgi:hypothetical protein